jgi:hypothetical protein
MVDRIDMFLAAYDPASKEVQWECKLCDAKGEATAASDESAAKAVSSHIFACDKCKPLRRVTGQWVEDGQVFWAYAEKDGKKFVIEPK